MDGVQGYFETGLWVEGWEDETSEDGRGWDSVMSELSRKYVVVFET